MIVLQLLKTLKFKLLFSLIKLFSRNILMIYPTIRATIKSIKIVDKLYPKIHHIDNSANAFRHALWNMLLIKEMMKWNKNLSKSIKWAKKVSDWHEDFSPNSPLAREMDLHNNERGRFFFEKHYTNHNLLAKSTIVEILRKETLKSKKVNTISEIKKFKEFLVYIED